MSFFYIGDDATSGHTQYGDDVAVVVVSGEIDYAASPQLRGCIFGHIKAGKRRLVLDLSEATFIDSTAIGVFVGAVVKLREAGGGALTVVCGYENGEVSRIFEIAGVDSLIALHRTREEALSALAVAG